MTDEPRPGITHAIAGLKTLRAQTGAQRATLAWDIGGADVVLEVEAGGTSMLVDGELVPMRERS